MRAREPREEAATGCMSVYPERASDTHRSHTLDGCGRVISRLPRARPRSRRWQCERIGNDSIRDGAIRARNPSARSPARDPLRTSCRTCRFTLAMRRFSHRIGRDLLRAINFSLTESIAMRGFASHPARGGKRIATVLRRRRSHAMPRDSALRSCMRACGHAGGVACAAPITRIVKCTVAQVFPVHTCAVATKRRRFHVCPGIDAVMPRCLDPATYQRYATDIWYCRPAIGRPMNTPPVAAPGTRTLPSVRPSVSVTLLPLAVTSQCSPTCRLAPMSSMS